MKNVKTYLLHFTLFVITLIFTTLSGIEWTMNKYLFRSAYTYDDLVIGLSFSLSFLGILTVHEFGHYFTARLYKLKVTLPYYIPFYLFGQLPSLGTFGAVIRIKEIISSRKQFFDIGIAGPLAGFVIALGALYYGFTNLPSHEYIFQLHPEYRQYGMDYPKYVYTEGIVMGTNLLLEFFIGFIADPTQMVHPYELIHFPIVLAGYFGCYFTALNLIPLGQLDGGHILYGLLGYEKSKKISVILFILFMFFGGLGLFSFEQSTGTILFSGLAYLIFLYFTMQKTWENKMTIWSIALSIFTVQLLLNSYIPGIRGFPVLLILGFILGRFLGVYHPKAIEDRPLSLGRKVLGWVALVVFVLCFSLEPIRVIGY